MTAVHTNPSDGKCPQKIALSIQDVADSLSIGLTYAKRLVAERKIRSVRIGRRVLIPKTAVEEYLASLEPSAK